MARIPKLTTTLAYDRYMAGEKLVSSVDRPWRHLVLRSYLEPAEQELLEQYIATRIEAGRPLPGTYPPNEETLAGYEAWRKQRG